MPFNRLLEYWPRHRLERMTDADRAELLAEVLHRGPSEDSWAAVCELFALWPPNDSKGKALESAERMLSQWDDQLRFMPSSSTGLYEGSRLSSFARLVRSIRIYRRGDGGRSELLAVVTSEEAVHLTRLSIIRSEIGGRAWRAMVESPYLTGLRHLQVVNTVMGDEIVQRLLHSAGLPRLQSLKLIEVGIDAQCLQALPFRPPFELKQIDLSRNRLGHEGVLLLSESQYLRSVEQLALRGNLVPASAMRALLSSTHIDRLKQVDLSDNRVTDNDRTALQRLAEDKGVQLTLEG
jgi:hypothetical protein